MGSFRSGSASFKEEICAKSFEEMKKVTFLVSRFFSVSTSKAILVKMQSCVVFFEGDAIRKVYFCNMRCKFIVHFRKITQLRPCEELCGLHHVISYPQMGAIVLSVKMDSKLMRCVL